MDEVVRKLVYNGMATKRGFTEHASTGGFSYFESLLDFSINEGAERGVCLCVQWEYDGFVYLAAGYPPVLPWRRVSVFLKALSKGVVAERDDPS